ncbi:hypothetical protein GETHLI_32860 [Geothrix limicola]|uniref:DJ-1/PfpI domain-containing protein n=1 Tax=Geothrix limicola TaxID=2927978 RepID=A0ABQ5QIT4_9BACT|nr:DJ-1/PfpI family protein [Geothrix limicola]GLH74784.1 hypothetical protein GETHLI_32860 [Geothrix limicola]
MNLASGLRASLVALCCLLASWPLAAQGQSAAPKGWACPPCDLPCDAVVHDKAGVCHGCGMALVQAPKKVAILIFDGVEIIDYTGPYEMFGAAGFQVFTVAATRHPVKTAMGMVVVPAYTFADAPRADVLVIPGGGVNVASAHADTLRYIKDTAAQAQHTLSVCNGAFILAQTGLLDGLTATTTRGNLQGLAKRHPKVKVVGDRRYVDNGKIITAAGLSAGIDGALHVIERLMGAEAATQVATYEEYAWKAGSEPGR